MKKVHLALALASALLASLSLAAPAALATPVTVRIEGAGETLLPATAVETSEAPVVADGNPAHACAGGSALGALRSATHGSWSGVWNSGFGQYEILGIDGEAHLFESGAPANFYWSLWLNGRESELGACEAMMHAGDEVLFFPACYGQACAVSPTPLVIAAPASAAVGEPVRVTVSRLSATGTPAPLAGATVTGAAAPATTDAEGNAIVTFSATGALTLRASAPQSVRAEASVCVHAGDDGNCGTPAPSGSGGVEGTRVVVAPPAPYRGPFALVPRLSGIADGARFSRRRAPRVLTGTVSAHSTVTLVRLELRRALGGRCWYYDGLRERFVAARCGHGASFEVARSASFSYLLPDGLPRGRYVLDVLAADAAGNTTTLARGTSRVVFDVR